MHPWGEGKHSPCDVFANSRSSEAGASVWAEAQGVQKPDTFHLEAVRGAGWVVPSMKTSAGVWGEALWAETTEARQFVFIFD